MSKGSIKSCSALKKLRTNIKNFVINYITTHPAASSLIGGLKRSLKLQLNNNSKCVSWCLDEAVFTDSKDSYMDDAVSLVNTIFTEHSSHGDLEGGDGGGGMITILLDPGLSDNSVKFLVGCLPDVEVKTGTNGVSDVDRNNRDGREDEGMEWDCCVLL